MPNLPMLDTASRQNACVIQIMFDTKIRELETALYVREITFSCDGHLKCNPSR